MVPALIALVLPRITGEVALLELPGGLQPASA